MTEADLREGRLIAIIRARGAEEARMCAEAAREGGARCIEITMNTPGALGLIAELAAAWPEAVLGAGTVLDVGAVRAAVGAGARFVVSPHVDADVIRATRDAGAVSIPGAATPTEIVAARRAGATLVKVFPIATLGGADYLRLVRGPLPDVPLVVTGGVLLEDVASLLAAGAVAVGATADLFAPDRVAAGDRAWLVERARQWVARAAG